MGVLKVNVGDDVTPVWRKIGCGGAAPSLTLDNTGNASGTTALSSNHTAGAVGDRVVHFVMAKPYNSVITEDTANCTLLGSSTSGSVANSAADTGSVRMELWTKILADTLTIEDNFQQPASTGQVIMARNYHHQPSTGLSSIAHCLLTDTDETGTSVSASGSIGAGDIVAGDTVLVTVALNGDSLTHSSQAFAIAGCTLSAITWTKSQTISGNDAGYYTAECTVTAGSSSGAVSYTATASVSGRSATVVGVVRVRAEAGASGRLKLWTGTEWVREACDGDITTDPLIQVLGTTGSGNHTLTLSAVAVGDLLLTFINMVSGDTPTAVPAGWTLERSDTLSGGFGTQTAYVYSRVATSADVASPSYTWGKVSANGWTSSIAQYRGPTGVQADTGSTTVGSTTLTAPSVTAAADGLLVVALQVETNAGLLASPTGMTERLTNTGGSGITSQYLYDEPVAAGATGTRSTTGSDPENTVGQSLILDVHPVTARPLKLNVGTPDTPDWVTVACMVPVELEPTMVTEIVVSMNGYFHRDQPDVLYLRRNGVELVNELGAVFVGSDAIGGSFTLEVNTAPSGTKWFTYNVVDPDTLSVVPDGDGPAGQFFGTGYFLLVPSGTWPTP